MSDTIRLQQMAEAILQQSKDPIEIEKAADLLRAAAEIENQRAETLKLRVEEQKLSVELKEAERLRKHGNTKDYISILAPLFTTLVLAGTLIQQSYQFVQSEKNKQVQFNQSEADKLAEVRRQQDRDEDSRWADAIKTLSQTEKLSPSTVILKSFVKSDRYGAAASQTALQVLAKTEDTDLFSRLFASILEPVSWSNAQEIVELDRSLSSNTIILYEKTWNPEKHVNDLTKLTKVERQRWDYLRTNTRFVSNKLAILLRGPRPAGTKLDLHSTDLWEEFQGADFSGANVESANFSGMDVAGAKFDHITGFSFSQFEGTAWWRAASMDPALVEDLVKRFPYREKSPYRGSNINKADFDTGVARLRALRIPDSKAH
jgi:uncharacterized protein YjbI with pentapeptide repeats